MLKFTGTGLSDADEAKIIAQGGNCNTVNNALVGVSITNKVISESEVTYTITGSTSVCFTVCYLRDSTWTVSTNTRSGVGTTTCPLPYSFISPSPPTVTITKPKSFRVISPASPAIGQVLQVEFVRAAEIGLTAQDSSYLVKCTIEGSNPLPSTFCDDKTAPQYVCEIAVNGVNVNCKAFINPAVMTSVGMELCACYKKSGQAKYALLTGSIKIGPRNPTYTISPYPFYVGQGAKLKFTGTDLSAADNVKIIAQGGNCNTDGNALVGVSITAKKGEQDTYTIMGSNSVCFTVCYRRGTVWTVSTNSDISKVTTTCTSASSSFITDTKLRYTLSPQEPSKQQTVTVTFKDDISYLVGSLIIIPIKEECVTSLCEGLAPCDHPPQSGDTYEVKTPTSGIFMATLKGSYVICTRATSASELPWIPIRNANPTGNRHYTFDVGDKVDASADKSSKTTGGKVPPKESITVPLIPGGNKTTTLSATAISSTIPAVLITSVVFLYLYNW